MVKNGLQWLMKPHYETSLTSHYDHHDGYGLTIVFYPFMIEFSITYNDNGDTNKNEPEQNPNNIVGKTCLSIVIIVIIITQQYNEVRLLLSNSLLYHNDYGHSSKPSSPAVHIPEMTN